jgi:hypothetical protein
MAQVCSWLAWYQPASKRLLPWLVAVAFFMESLDTTILNTAVPAISAASMSALSA